MKKIISVIMAILMIATMSLTLASCGAGSDMDAVKEDKKLVVGVTIYPPMDYIDDETGEWTGFDAELAKAYAKELGVNCQIVIIDWNNKVADLNSRQIDLIWNGMTASDELGEKIDFSVSYAKNAQVAVVKKNSNLTKDGIKNATVAVENGSAGETVARETIGATNLVEKSDGQVGALSEVLAGTSDVAIIDLTMAQSVVGKGQYADLMVMEGASYGDEIFAVGLRKGSDLKESLDAFLKAKYADGTITALAEKYSVGVNVDALK